MERMPAFMEQGNCRSVDVNTMYPDLEDPQAVETAKQVCMGCSVGSLCLEYAMGHKERFGVWGNTTEPERQNIHRVQRRRRNGSAKNRT